jgi:arginine repressor
MSKKPPSNEQKILFKKRFLIQICELLKEQGVGLEASQVAAHIPELGAIRAKRYLDELFVANHVSRTQSPDARKRAWAYRYLSDYGAKTDLVSQALANPLHQLVTKIVPKREAARVSED